MNRLLKTLVVIASITALVSPVAVSAQTSPAPATKQAMPMATAPAGDMIAGEVRKVDKDTRKITLKHDAMSNLDMPAMTMVFQVKDPAMLDMVKAGDKVKFKAAKPGGAFTIVEMAPVK